jgi:hypothetical protein
MKNGVDRYNIFFKFLHKGESSFLCRFHIESVNVLFNSTIRFESMCFFVNNQFGTEFGFVFIDFITYFRS